MNKKTTNENLVNNSNQPQQEQKMVQHIDELLLERLPELIGEELKWIRKEYGNNEMSEFLCGESYYSYSVLLNKIEKLINEY